MEIHSDGEGRCGQEDMQIETVLIIESIKLDLSSNLSDCVLYVVWAERHCIAVEQW